MKSTEKLLRYASTSALKFPLLKYSQTTHPVRRCPDQKQREGWLVLTLDAHDEKCIGSRERKERGWKKTQKKQNKSSLRPISCEVEVE